jgi:hypothetical protein
MNYLWELSLDGRELELSSIKGDLICENCQVPLFAWRLGNKCYECLVVTSWKYNGK